MKTKNETRSEIKELRDRIKKLEETLFKLRLKGFLPFALIAVVAVVISTGCMTSKVAQVQPNGTTNYVTVVNEVNLALDCEGIKLGAAGTVVAVEKLTHNDPKAIQAMQVAQTTIDGVLHGTSTATRQDILNILNKSGNATLAKEAESFAETVSNIEQKYLQGVSATVAGEITVKINQAIDDGLALGLSVNVPK